MNENINITVELFPAHKVSWLNSETQTDSYCLHLSRLEERRLFLDRGNLFPPYRDCDKQVQKQIQDLYYELEDKGKYERKWEILEALGQVV